MESIRRRRALLLLCIAALLGLIAVVIAESQASTVQAYGGYQSQKTQFQQAMAAAQASGYTDADLQPITEKLALVMGAQEPVWIGDRAGFYRQQTAALAQLRAALGDQEQAIGAQVRSDAQQQLGAAESQIQKDQQLGVDDASVGGFQTRHDQLAGNLAAAKSVTDVRKIAADAGTLLTDAQKAGAAQQAENDAIQQAADQAFAQQNGNLDGLRRAGQTALANARNDATIAAYEAKPGRFAPLDKVMASYSRLEKFAGQLGSGDAHAVAYAAAAIQHYGAQVHELVFNNLGPKHLIVNWTAQEAYAYEGSKQVMDSLVTTGIRGVSVYGTDFGPMKVLHTDHPWTMHSPFPKGSQYWYPDTVVQWTVFFTWTGESFHDAYWEPDSQLGPGSQFDASTRSHGCVHLPYGLAHWLYGWADIGTPVDVVPGDGQPVQAQLAEMTTDDQGNPLSSQQQ